MFILIQYNNFTKNSFFKTKSKMFFYFLILITMLARVSLKKKKMFYHITILKFKIKIEKEDYFDVQYNVINGMRHMEKNYLLAWQILCCCNKICS